MTVADLIKKLSEFPQDMTVVVGDHEWGDLEDVNVEHVLTADGMTNSNKSEVIRIYGN